MTSNAATHNSPPQEAAMWIYALAIGTNFKQETSVRECLDHLQTLGKLTVSPVFETAPEDGIGEKYLNLAVLLTSSIAPVILSKTLKDIENKMGRVRKIHHVLIDIDLIAYGNTLAQMTLVSRRLPLAHYVTLPLSHIWQQWQAQLI